MVAVHADAAVYPPRVDRATYLEESSRPRFYVQIVGIDERSVDVEENRTYCHGN